MIKFKDLPSTTKVSLVGAAVMFAIMFVLMACFGEFMQPHTNRIAVVLLVAGLGCLLIAYISFTEEFAAVQHGRLALLEGVTSDAINIVLDMPRGDALVESRRADAQAVANALGHERATRFATGNDCAVGEVSDPPSFGYQRDASRSRSLRAYDARRSGDVAGHLG